MTCPVARVLRRNGQVVQPLDTAGIQPEPIVEPAVDLSLLFEIAFIVCRRQSDRGSHLAHDLAGEDLRAIISQNAEATTRLLRKLA